ncbi:MAG: hypothetical protein ACRENX_03765, partial [Candidatus Dormibacteria bacterium]
PLLGPVGVVTPPIIPALSAFSLSLTLYPAPTWSVLPGLGDVSVRSVQVLIELVPTATAGFDDS